VSAKNRLGITFICDHCCVNTFVSQIVACVFSPTLLSNFVEYPELDQYDVSSLKVMNSGGSPLLKAVYDKVKVTYEYF